MPNLNVDQIRKIMDNKDNIRNMCVIAQYPISTFPPFLPLFSRFLG
jgi:hypothetical protein